MARLIVFLLAVLPLSGQNADSALTQTLIAEIRALRQDLQATNVTSQRVQIALYRLQSQTAVMTAAQQHVEAARTKLAEVQNQRRSFANQLQFIEESLRNATDANERKRFQDDLPRMKIVLEGTGAEEAARQNAVSEAESQLRAEQARLSDLQSLLDRLDKALEDVAGARK